MSSMLSKSTVLWSLFGILCNDFCVAKGVYMRIWNMFRLDVYAGLANRCDFILHVSPSDLNTGTICQRVPTLRVNLFVNRFDSVVIIPADPTHRACIITLTEV